MYTFYDVHLAFSAVLFGAVVVFYLTRPAASVYHPVTYYLFFHGLVFVVRPFFQYYGHYDLLYRLYRFYPTMGEKHLALEVANLGMISFVSACLFVGNEPMRFAEPAEAVKVGRNRPGGGAILAALLLCSPLIIISFRDALSQIGADRLVNMVRDAATNNAVFTNTTGYIVDANQMLGAFAVLIAWLFRFKLISLVPFVTFLALRMSMGWGRWTFVMTTASLGLLYMYDHRKKWVSWRIMLVGAVILVLFDQLGASRVYIASLLTGKEYYRSVPRTTQERAFFDKMDFANLEFLEFVVYAVPDKTRSYDYFSPVLEVFTAPIPRVMWKSKPIGPPIKFFNLNNYGYPIGITYSLPGVGWMGLGFPGVVFWCVSGGLIWGWFYRWWVLSDQRRYKTSLFLVLLPLSVQWFRDGILLTMVKFPLFVVTPILVWYVMEKLFFSGRPQVALSRWQAAPQLETPPAAPP